MVDQDSLWEGTVNPGREYGPVPLWWWDGDDLDDRRLSDQLEALAAGGIGGVCLIEKHPTGHAGDELDYFGEEWWDHLQYVVDECDRLGLDLWVHDETYHHSPPNHRKFWQHRLEVEAGSDPGLRGEALRHVGADVTAGEACELTIPHSVEPVTAAAYPREPDGTLRAAERVAIDVTAEQTVVEWAPPDGDREWHVGVIGREPAGLRYTTRDAVERYIDLHFDEYVRRLGDRVGDVLVGTFEDELLLLQPEYPHDETINVPGGEEVFDRFREDHGYDPESRLVELFADASAETAQLRTDYYDVVTTLLEECWFEPLYEWHEEHGLRRSHDNFGRLSLAKQTIQYGDYMRTMRWYQAPGYDDGNIDPKAIETVHDIPIGDRNFFDARLAASVAAAYERPRVWGELLHSTGWGYPPEKQLAAIAENVCYGMNLYDKHGLYYSTMGGWWEHAPPDTHFRQPYWGHIDGLNDAATRLSALFSEGSPGFDTAVLYPASTMHARWHPTDGIDDLGHEIDDATRELLESLYSHGRDPAFLDAESVQRADIGDGRLSVGEVDVPAFVLGPTTTVDAATLRRIREFFDAGGTVVAVDRLPTTLAGGSRETLVETLEHVFGTATVPDAGHTENAGDAGGVGLVAVGDCSVASLLEDRVEQGVDAPDGIYHGHRRTEAGDAYLLLNTDDRKRTATVTLPTDGTPELWDLLDGTRREVEHESEGGSLDLTLPFEPHEHHVVVVDGAGEHEPPAEASLSGSRRDPPDDEQTVLDGDWEVEPRPSLHNEWEDFRHPASKTTISPEIRQFRYRSDAAGTDGIEAGWHRADADANEWEPVEWSVGPYLWRAVTDGDEPLPSPAESLLQWTPYTLSLLTGVSSTTPQFGGLVGRAPSEFLAAPDCGERVHFWTTVRADTAGPVVCHYGENIDRLRVGERVLAGGTAIGPPGSDGHSSVVSLPEGPTPVQLTVEPGTDTHLAFERPPATADENRPVEAPRVPWFDGTDALQFDAKPWAEDPVGWYRFDLPAGTRGFDLPVDGEPRVWVDGEEVSVDGDSVDLATPPSAQTPVAVRVEQSAGRYGGAAWTAPVELDVGPARRDLTDWRKLGFGAYSGTVRYTTTATVPQFDGDDRVVLDLGDVAVSAAVSVNGSAVGEQFARPYRFDVTEAVTPGENRVAVDVANTLANHLAEEVPTRYVYDDLDRRRSGLFGPVTVSVRSR